MTDPTITILSYPDMIENCFERSHNALRPKTEILLEINGAAATLRLISQTVRRDGEFEDIETSLIYVLDNLIRNAQELQVTYIPPKASQLN